MYLEQFLDRLNRRMSLRRLGAGRRPFVSRRSVRVPVFYLRTGNAWGLSFRAESWRHIVGRLSSRREVGWSHLTPDVDHRLTSFCLGWRG
jgi:hypothetical protein